MEPQEIVVSGAREHNLKNVSLTLPRNKFICFTGVSGSGKSSFAFDTLFAEGQRRYLESLSSYARQFLGQLAKPNVDRITGLSPAISIQQKTSGWNPRSTVGTVTQIHDYLRVLFARVGRQHCPKCGQAIKAQTREQIIARILELPEGTRILILGPVVRGQKGEYRDLFDDMVRQGYARARVDGTVVELKEAPDLARHVRHNIEIVADRLTVSLAIRPRLSEAVESALKLGQGTLIVQLLPTASTAARDNSESSGQPRWNPRSDEVDESSPTMSAPSSDCRSLHAERASLPPTADGPRDLLLSSHYACLACDLSFEPPSPQLFSFNSPTGMCQRCDGLGTTFDFDPELLVPDPGKSFLQHAIEPMSIHMRIRRWRRHIYQGVADHVGFDLKTPWQELPAKARRALLFGLGDTHLSFRYRSWGGKITLHGGTFEGVIAELRDRHRKTQSAFMRAYYEKYMRQAQCPECRGGRLNAQARSVRVGGKTLSDVAAFSIEEALRFFGGLSAAYSRPSATTDAAPDDLMAQRTDGPGALGPIPNITDPMGATKTASSDAKDLASGHRRAKTSRAPEKPRSISVESRRGIEGRVPTSIGLSEQPVLTAIEWRIAVDVLKEIRGRLKFLIDVGLGYLSLDRAAPTLSGGESQRIRLASQIGAGLVGVLYILDEPSIGLHPRDNEQLLDSLKRLRDLGNTVIVVEHDEQTMREADEIVDFGPGPGVRGGEVVAQGDLVAIARSKESVTARYLRSEEGIAIPAQRRPVHAHGGQQDPSRDNEGAGVTKRRNAKAPKCPNGKASRGLQSARTRKGRKTKHG